MCKKWHDLCYFNRCLLTIMCSMCCTSLHFPPAVGHLHEQSKLSSHTIMSTVQPKSQNFEKTVPSKWIHTGNKNQIPNTGAESWIRFTCLSKNKLNLSVSQGQLQGIVSQELHSLSMNENVLSPSSMGCLSIFIYQVVRKN